MKVWKLYLGGKSIGVRRTTDDVTPRELLSSVILSDDVLAKDLPNEAQVQALRVKFIERVVG